MTPRATALLVTAALAAAVTGCGSSGHTVATRQSGGGDAAAARATVERYFAALGGHDAAAACSQLTAESRKRLSEFGGDALHMRAHSCSRTLKRLFASPAGPRLRTLANARIASVQVTGEGAVVAVRGVDAPVKVVRDQGAWRIESSPTGETR